jgi:hypothetical protein
MGLGGSKARKYTFAEDELTAVGVSTPAIIFISVDFPAPLPPISACTWPESSVKSICFSTVTPENCLPIWRASSSGFIIAPHFEQMIF